ncbi:MAG: transporter [Proteobacteria bacterium]|nr:MAG: transporter [Pseudomonadota bacterium]
MKTILGPVQLPRKRLCTAVLGLAVAMSLAGVSPAYAIDVDAGDYTALPEGTNLALVYYQNAERNKLFADGDKQSLDANLDSQVGILRYVHFTKLGGYTVDPQFLLPFGELKAGGDVSSLGEASGVGDLILAATVWLVNEPEQGTYFGITPFLYLPTGSYDKNDALNLGENRWKFALQAGYITSLTDTLKLDLIGDVTVFGDNTDFGAAGKTLEQDPQYQFQAHLRYQVSPVFDLRLGLSHTVGGETSVDGADQNDSTRTTKWSLGAGYFVTPTVQLLATYGQDVSVRNGFKENSRVNLRLLKLF